MYDEVQKCKKNVHFFSHKKQNIDHVERETTQIQ